MQASDPPSREDPLSARRAALALLRGVLESESALSDQMASKASPLTALTPPERARAQRLATETLRALRRADQILGPFLRLVPAPPVHAILRLATVELLEFGSAPHGVVNSWVELARELGTGDGPARLVNAVLRKVAQTEAEKWQTLPPSRLPKPLRKRLIAAYRGKTVEAMEAVFSTFPPLDLTPRETGGAERIAQELGGTALPTGSVRLSEAGQVSTLAGYGAGDWWVQDVAAALPVRLLDLPPGARVIDLCAAPGGKTLQLAARGYDVTAVDLSADRLRRLEENLARTGLTAKVVTGDALTVPLPAAEAILLDAPCSATGTIRRHPDLPHVKSLEDLSALTTLQAALIDRAADHLASGGLLLYATCSLLPEEGEAQAEAVRKRRPDLAPVPLEDQLASLGGDASWITGPGCLRLRPDFWADRGGMDGFFIAIWRKTG